MFLARLAPAFQHCFVGHTAQSSSPRGRFGDGAAVLNEDANHVAHPTGQPCRVCGQPIHMELMAGRKLHFCPVCQIL